MDLKKQIKENKFLILILLLALTIRVIFVFVSPLPYWDETVYANLGRDLSINPFDYSFANHGWSDYIPGGGWPKAGYRPPLLPYIFAIFYFLGIDYLNIFLMPLIGTLSVLAIYILGKKLFSKEVGLYSAAFISLLPVHVLYSSKMLNDAFATFFITITIISFWKGYEEKNSKHKILFGLFFALSILARYTALWMGPVFLFYFIIRDKSIKFLKDKYLWYSILTFFMTMLPLFIYGYFTYGNPLGAFIDGFSAAAFWGGKQPWYFYIQYWNVIYSIMGIVFLISIFYIIYKKKFLKKEFYLLLIWVIFFFIMASLMAHKEERYILPIIPAVCLICGEFISKINKYKNAISVAIAIVLLVININFFYNEYSNYHNMNTKCFSESMDYLNSLDEDFKTVSENPPFIYYFVHKESAYYPDNLNEGSIKELARDNKWHTLFF
jgi:4-amino-4-deoxy-L-arabinose transferase-like glycosyltransferase